MNALSSMHGVVMLGLTLGSTLSLGAGCVVPPEDEATTADVAEMGGEEDASPAEDPADTEIEEVGSAQEALVLPLDSGWISGWPGSAWRKWHTKASKDTATGALVTQIWGYACNFGASCSAAISANIRYNPAHHRTIITVSGGGSASYVRARIESGSLNSRGVGFLQSYTAALNHHRISTVGHSGHGRMLSTTGCVGGWFGFLGTALYSVYACGTAVAGTAAASAATAGAAAFAGVPASVWTCAAGAAATVGIALEAASGCGAP